MNDIDILAQSVRDSYKGSEYIFKPALEVKSTSSKLIQMGASVTKLDEKTNSMTIVKDKGHQMTFMEPGRPAPQAGRSDDSRDTDLKPKSAILEILVSKQTMVQTKKEYRKQVNKLFERAIGHAIDRGVLFGDGVAAPEGLASRLTSSSNGSVISREALADIEFAAKEGATGSNEECQAYVTSNTFAKTVTTADINADKDPVLKRFDKLYNSLPFVGASHLNGFASVTNEAALFFGDWSKVELFIWDIRVTPDPYTHMKEGIEKYNVELLYNYGLNADSGLSFGTFTNL